jgi:hypothetical protein
MDGEHGREAAEDCNQREGAQAGDAAGGVFALQAHQEAQQQCDSQLLKARFHQSKCSTIRRMGGRETGIPGPGDLPQPPDGARMTP